MWLRWRFSADLSQFDYQTAERDGAYDLYRLASNNEKTRRQIFKSAYKELKVTLSEFRKLLQGCEKDAEVVFEIGDIQFIDLPSIRTESHDRIVIVINTLKYDHTSDEPYFIKELTARQLPSEKC